MDSLPAAFETPGSSFGTAGSTLIPGKKRRAHVGQACMNCRRRKTKCDGRPPRCLTCQNYQDDCEWDDTPDGRRNANRTQVQALRDRIKELEGKLGIKGEDKSGDGGEEVDQGEVGDHGVNEKGESSVGGRDEESEVDRVVNTMLHLHVSDAGDEVQYYGPTSAYAHSTQTSQTHRPISPSHNSPTPNPTSDFRRHLPPFPRLTCTQHQIVLDRFFMFFAAWNLRAHPHLFFVDLQLALTLPPDRALPRYPLYSPFLHNIILALALKWADEPKLRTEEVRAMFARQADRYLVGELARPVLATVQGLAVKSSYHSTEGDHTTGWAYFGMGERLSNSLGLNVDCAPLVQQGVMTADEMRRRTDTFWTITMQEQTWAVYLGRPHAVQEYSTPHPTIDTALDQTAFRWGSSPSSGQPGMVSSAFVETAKLTVIMQRVMTALYSLTSDLAKLQKDNTISRLGADLDTWAEQLPASLVISSTSTRNALPHILMLHLAREWITILIYRPYYRPVASRPGIEGKHKPATDLGNIAVKRCDKAATRILTLLRTYSHRYNLAYCPPTMFNITFTAGTTHLLAATRHTKAKREEALGMAEECVRCLRNVAGSWTAAGQKADILVGLIKAHRPEVERPIGRAVPNPAPKEEEAFPCQTFDAHATDAGPADMSLSQQPTGTWTYEPYIPASIELQSTSSEFRPSTSGSTSTYTYQPFGIFDDQPQAGLAPDDFALDYQSLSSLFSLSAVPGNTSSQHSGPPHSFPGVEIWPGDGYHEYGHTSMEDLMGSGQSAGGQVGGTSFS